MMLSQGARPGGTGESAGARIRGHERVVSSSGGINNDFSFTISESLPNKKSDVTNQKLFQQEEETKG